ncbi:MAG: site-specific integrase, partial [bacterium]|nr:site-specific integrase [bacterium]MDW8164524.1 site-specific integrase [Candidatus Omnitrophota bacterium]
DFYIGKVRKRISTRCTKKKDAQEVMKKLVFKFQSQYDVNKNMTLYQAMDMYVENYSKPFKESYLRDVLSAKNIKRKIPDLPLKEVTPFLISTWQRQRAQDKKKNGSPISSRTVNIERAFLHRVFEIARKEWMVIQTNPVSVISPLKYTPKPAKVYTKREYTLIFDTCEKLGMVWFKEFLEFLLYTGFRVGEAQKLRCKDIDFERKSILIIREKNKQPQNYPIIIERVYEILKKHTEGKNLDDFVFTNPSGNPITDKIKRVAWKKIKKETGISGRIYDFRHTNGTLLLEVGTPEIIISKLLGHKNLSTTLLYIHPEEKQCIKYLEKLGKIL